MHLNMLMPQAPELEQMAILSIPLNAKLKRRFLLLMPSDATKDETDFMQAVIDKTVAYLNSKEKMMDELEIAAALREGSE